MDSSALLSAYLYTVLRQNAVPMPMFGQPMPSNLVDLSTYGSSVPTPQVKPNVQPLPKKKSFTINSILDQGMLDAPSPPSSALSTPSTLPSSPSPASPTVKTRVAFTPAITKILCDWFDAHLDSPYLDDDATLMLIETTHLSKTQLKNWFTNRRRSYEQQHGHVKWVKKAAPACARMKRPAQQDAAEPAKKMARVSTN